jgi:feruloyl esterase
MIRSILLLASSASFLAYAQSDCTKLKSLSLPDTAITSAELVAAGPWRPPAAGPGGGGAQAPAIQLPAHCVIAATLTPSADSHIDIEVWLPASDWNGKYEAVGGGGWAGVISYTALASALQEGYATSSTDTGHKGGDATFAPGHPEKVVDFAYRAVHEMTLKAKAIINAYYGRAPKLSYWNGCSTGGRQGLMEAQRYPEDFDAILAGAAANYQTHLHAFDLNLQTSIRKEPGAFVPLVKLNLLNKAVLDACDAQDGVKDGFLNNPPKCNFDPAVLACKSGDAEICLTPPQLEAVKRAYAPVKTQKGDVIYPGYAKGSEAGWNVLIGQTADPVAVPLATYRYVLNQDPKWDWHNFDLERDVAAVDEKYGYINAIQPDLSAFKNRGGKLLTYHGWNDAGISPNNSVNYHETVVKKMGGKQDNWYRLFMVPGMGHCQGGPGPNQFNMMGALERWRETGKAPDQILAEHVTTNRVDMTRPLCPYPQVAVWSGVGSTNDASNFSCKVQ